MRFRGTSVLFLITMAALTGCNSVSDLVSTDPNKLLTITVAPSSMPADGASRVTLTAKIPASSSTFAREIEFTTTLGTFVGYDTVDITVPADIDGQALVELRSGAVVGTAHVLARYGDIAKGVAVEFKTAPPEFIDIESDRASVSVRNAEEARLTVHVRRALGTASAGTRVEFEALTSSGQKIGTFTGVSPSDELGAATAVYYPGFTNYRGFVLIRAWYRAAGGGVIEGRVRISVEE